MVSVHCLLRWCDSSQENDSLAQQCSKVSVHLLTVTQKVGCRFLSILRGVSKLALKLWLVDLCVPDMLVIHAHPGLIGMEHVDTRTKPKTLILR